MIIFYCRERSRGSKNDVEIKHKSHITNLLNTSQVKGHIDSASCAQWNVRPTANSEMCGHCFCFFFLFGHIFLSALRKFFTDSAANR